MAIETSFSIKQLNVDEALKQAENKVKQSAEKMDKDLSKTGSGTKTGRIIGGILGADAIKAAAGKIKDYISEIIDKVGNLGETAGNMGITGEQLQGIQYAAKQAGLEVEALPNAFSKLKDAAGSALNGDAGAAAKFARIGISVSDLKGKKPWEIFELTADAINDIKDPVEKTNAGIDLFGKSFDKMGEFLKSYKSSISDLQGRGIITEEQIKAADELCDKISDLQTQLATLAVNSGFLDEINEILQGLDAWLNMANKLKKSGIVTREQAVNEAISKAEASGKYSDDELEGMREVKKSYSKGVPLRGWGIYGVSNAYAGTYRNLDKVLEEANPLYKGLGRDKEGNFSSTGEMTMPVSNADIEAERRRKEEEKNKREERQRVQEQYRRDQIKQASGNVVDAEAEKRKKLDESDKKMVSAAASEKMKTTVEQIVEKEKQKTAESEKQARIQKEIDALKAKTYSKEDYKQQGKDIADIAKKETEIRESKSEQLKIEIDIDKLKQKAADYYREAKDNLDAELAVQKKINEGKFEEAERQKIINDLKAKGLTVNEKEIDAMMKRKKELAALRFDDSMKQSGYDLLYQQQKKSNYRQAEYDKRIRDKERELGGPLNDAQKSKIYDMLDIEIKMNMEPKLDFRNTDIKTNDLTARGGFSTGAVVVPKDRINEQIRGYAARQVSLLSQIKALLGQEGII